MADRHVYLRIEGIASYNPVNPEPKPAPPRAYKRDCMHNPGHEDGTIPDSEVAARALPALVYREYLDPAYSIPKPDKIVPADINEPLYYARVPATVIYAHPPHPRPQRRQRAAQLPPARPVLRHSLKLYCWRWPPVSGRRQLAALKREGTFLAAIARPDLQTFATGKSSESVFAHHID